MNTKRNKKGFTIVELVIVIAVIGILSAILIPTFVNLTKNAKVAAYQSECANAYTAYVADSVDNEADEQKATTGSKLTIYFNDTIARENVILQNGSKYYTFGEKNWEEKDSATVYQLAYFLDSTSSDAKTGIDVEYNGYKVFAKAVQTF